ncbi:MAG: hypothetical protein ACKO38_15770 [Planctomycetota bacterium]
MSERKLFPCGALARTDAPFRDADGANTFRDTGAKAVDATNAGTVAATVVADDNVFASPQAGEMRAFQAGDFVATESDSSGTLLIASKIALGFSGFGWLVLGTVMSKLVLGPFALLSVAVYLVSGGIAVTTILRVWQEASLRKIGVIRDSNSGAGRRATVYAVFAGVLALSGLAATTVGWFS